VVLRRGRVTERGSHRQLGRAGGWYQHMCEVRSNSSPCSLTP
jgi:ABC-type multidrug transport system fused ATPase/permease subunit